MKPPDEIITTLEHCTKLRFARYCEEQCPYYAHGLSCLRNLHADAAAYIKRLEAKEERK